jgi:hypothetical protein
MGDAPINVCEPACLSLDCFYDCDYVFGAPVVLPSPEGGTIVQWELDPVVRDLGKYVYTLQAGDAGVRDDKAWTDVVTAEDVFYLIDPYRWAKGIHRYKHYRLRLVTGERVYYSRPLHTFGHLSYGDWRLYVSVIRAEAVHLRSRSGTEGILFKRKISGVPCRRCRDHNTGEVTDAGCRICYGTGWVGGYYMPVFCSWFSIDPVDMSVAQDIETQGTIRVDTSCKARAIAVPCLSTNDIWLNKQSGERYKVMQIHNIVEVKGVPVVHQVSMDRLPVSDIVYSLSVD